MEDDQPIIEPAPSDPGTSVHDDFMAGEELATLPPAQVAGSGTGNSTLHTHDGDGLVEPEPILGAASGDPAHEPAGTGARSLPQDHSSRMETGFGSLSPLFTILPQTIYVRGPSPGSAMQDMPLTAQSQWMEECIRAFDVTASVSNRGLRNAATVDLITEALQKHLQSVESRSVSLCDVTDTLVHMTDVTMSSDILKTYLKVVIQGDYRARKRLIKAHWVRTSTGWNFDDEGNGKSDHVAAEAMQDTTPSSGDVGVTIHDSYGENILTFDVILELAMSYFLNYSDESDEQRLELEQSSSAIRRLQGDVAECNQNSADLLAAAHSSGAEVTIRLRDALRQLNQVERNLVAYHLRVITGLVLPRSMGKSNFNDSMNELDTEIDRAFVTLKATQASMSRLREITGAAPGNTTVGSEAMRAFMMTGSASTEATTVPELGSYSGSGSGSSTSTQEIPSPSDLRRAVPSPIPHIRLPPLDYSQLSPQGRSTSDLEEKAPPPVEATSRPPVQPEDHPRLDVPTDAEVQASLLAGHLTSKEWSRFNSNQQKEIFRFYRSICCPDGLHHRMITEFLPHMTLSPDAGLLDKLTSGFLNHEDGFNVLCRIVSESAVSVFQLLDRTRKIPGRGAGGELGEIEVGERVSSPEELTFVAVEALRYITTDRSHDSPDDTETVKETKKLLQKISDRGERELDAKNKDSKIQKLLLDMFEAGTNDPDVISKLIWDYFLWMLSGDQQSQSSSGLSLPLSTILTGCGVPPSFDEATGLSGTPREIFSSQVTQLVRLHSPGPVPTDEESVRWGLDTFLDDKGPTRDDDLDDFRSAPSEHGSYASQQHCSGGGGSDSGSEYVRSLEHHLWSQIIGIFLILGPGLDGTVLGYPKSMRIAADVCAKASEACIKALKHAWCTFPEAYPNSEFGQKARNSTTTNRDGHIDLQNVCDRAVNPTYDSKAKAWYFANPGRKLPRREGEILASVAYMVPKAVLGTHNTTYLLLPWSRRSYFGNLPFPHPNQVGATTPPLFEITGILVHNEKAFSWASLANFWLHKVSTFPTPWKAFRALSIIAGQMQGDVNMTVEDNMQCCQLLQDFVGVHCGFGECRTLLENLGIAYTTVTVQGVARQIPVMLTAQALAANRLVWLATNTSYRGGTVFANMAQEPSTTEHIRKLEYATLYKELYVNRFLELPAFQRNQDAVDPDASARRLRKLAASLQIDGKVKWDPAFSLLCCALGVDCDGSGGEPASGSTPATSDNSDGPASEVTVVAAAIPAEILAMADSQVANHYRSELDAARDSNNGFQVFDALGGWTRVATSNQRRVEDRRPMLEGIRQAVDELLPTSLRGLLVIKPPKQLSGKVLPEMLSVDDKLGRAAAKSVCRFNGGNGGLVNPNNLTKPQRAVVDFCLARFAPPNQLTRWPDTLFHILKRKFPGDFTRETIHRDKAVVAYANEMYYARPPTGVAGRGSHVLVLSLTGSAKPGSDKTKDRKLKKAEKAKKAKEKADKEAADKAAADASSTGAADGSNSAATPPASGSGASPGPVPLTDAEREFLEQAELRRSTILATRAARDQAATVQAVASSAATQAATSVVNQLHAQAGMAPAAPPPPAAEVTPPAVIEREDAELDLINEQLRRYGR